MDNLPHQPSAPWPRALYVASVDPPGDEAAPEPASEVISAVISPSAPVTGRRWHHLTRWLPRLSRRDALQEQARAVAAAAVKEQLDAMEADLATWRQTFPRPASPITPPDQADVPSADNHEPTGGTA